MITISSNKKLLITLSVIAGAILLALTLFLTNLYTSTNKYVSQSYILGAATQKGYIGVELTYDMEPPNIIITSPHGIVYTSTTAAFYENNEKSKIIKLYADTDDLGNDLDKWTVSFDKGSNKSITYKFINMPSPSLYITGEAVQLKSDKYDIVFTPTQAIGNYSNCLYTIKLETENHLFTLASGTAKLNEQSRTSIDIPIDAFDCDKGIITITVKSKDHTPKTNTAQLNVNLILNEVSNGLENNSSSSSS